MNGFWRNTYEFQFNAYEFQIAGLWREGLFDL